MRRNCAAASASSRSGSGLDYDAGFACQASFARRRRGLVRLASGSLLRASVFKQIRLGWSPQQVSGRLKLMHQPQTVSHETIYQPIYVLPKGELRRDFIGRYVRGENCVARATRTKTGAEPCPIWCPCMTAPHPCSQDSCLEIGKVSCSRGRKRQRHRHPGRTQDTLVVRSCEEQNDIQGTVGRTLKGCEQPEDLLGMSLARK